MWRIIKYVLFTCLTLAYFIAWVAMKKDQEWSKNITESWKYCASSCYVLGYEDSVEIWAVHQKEEWILIKAYVVQTCWYWQHHSLIFTEKYIESTNILTEFHGTHKILSWLFYEQEAFFVIWFKGCILPQKPRIC